MKRLLLLALTAGALASAAHTFHGASARGGAEEAGARPYLENWVSKSLGEMNKVKVGMTRADLLQVFREEGGISNRAQRTYVYKECRYFKVDVKFEPVGNVEQRLAEAPEDKIVEISKPYIAYTVTD